MPALKVAFVWHMHQPWYLWPGTREAALPFARLHACSGYYDMPWLLNHFARTTVVFNLVPSLTEQIVRHARGETTDHLLELSRRPAGDLEPEEQADLLTHFATGHPESVLEASPRYARLLHKRGLVRHTESIQQVSRLFTVEEYRDVQVWLNLAWCGYALRREAEVVRELRAKDQGFTEDEKLALLDAMREATGRVLPLYREVAAAGRAELTTSPFYHPILPLLCDMRDADRVIPRADLPERLWQAPAEARAHLERAVAHHEAQFGVRAQGLWSPEGAVSDASLALIEEAGFDWTASDQHILALSLRPPALGRLLAEDLYRPYRVGDGNLALIFRDHGLSDRIGFIYRGWKPADGAQDLVGYLRRIASVLPASGPPGLVSIILDGENPWGSYPDGGEGFLRELYAAIEAAPDLETTSVSRYLQEFPPQARLDSVFPGSWIDHSFRTWIGNAEHKRAWTLLGGALDTVQQATAAGSGASSDVLARARDHLMIAEGSDWFWWQSEQHHAEDEPVFDALFRSNIAEVYRRLGLPVPVELGEAISAAKSGWLTQDALAPMHATLDGRVTDYFEWQGAALLRTSAMASAMHRCECVVLEIYLGFDPDTLWLRVDTVGRADETLRGCRLRFLFAGETERELVLQWPADGAEGPPQVLGDLAAGAQAAVDRIVEVGISLSALGAQTGGEVRVALAVECGDRPIERWPQLGFLTLKLPTEDSLTDQWTA